GGTGGSAEAHSGHGEVVVVIDVDIEHIADSHSNRSYRRVALKGAALAGKHCVKRIGAARIAIVVVQPVQQSLDIAERSCSVVVGECRASLHRNVVLSGSGGKHAQVLA